MISFYNSPTVPAKDIKRYFTKTNNVDSMISNSTICAIFPHIFHINPNRDFVLLSNFVHTVSSCDSEHLAVDRVFFVKATIL